METKLLLVIIFAPTTLVSIIPAKELFKFTVPLLINFAFPVDNGYCEPPPVETTSLYSRYIIISALIFKVAPGLTVKVAPE